MLSDHQRGLFWLFRMRWIAIVFLTLSTYPALRLALLRQDDVWLYLSFIGLLALVNITSQHYSIPVKEQNASALFQLSIDVLCLSALLALMGGAWNPLTPLLYFHAALGGLMLRNKQSWIFFLIVCFCFLLLNLVVRLPPILEASPVPRYIQLPSQIIVALSIWSLTQWLSSKLESSYKRNRILEEQKSKLDKLRAAGALAAGFSHEFATPLNTLKMRMERIFRKNEINGDDQSIAEESLAKCEDILRKMSATNSKPDSIQIEKVEMNQFLQAVVNSWNKNHEEILKTKVIQNVKDAIYCEIPSLIFTSSLLNIFDNSKEAGANSVVLTADLDGENNFVMTITDSGEGWPEEIKRHFGQPFLSLKKRGSGLGLYNAKTLMEALGGSLEIFDPKNKGAGVKITIPTVNKVSS